MFYWSQKMYSKNSLIEMLKYHRIVSIKGKDEEPFTLESGKKSRLFISMKDASLNPDILKEIVLGITDIANNHRMYFDKIASIELGSVPLGTALELEWDEHQVIIRSATHTRGLKQKIIDDVAGMHCLLVDDVATTGGSLLQAVQDLRDAGAIVTDAIVIVDREEGANDACLQNGVYLHTLLTKSDFGIKEEV